VAEIILLRTLCAKYTQYCKALF